MLEDWEPRQIIQFGNKIYTQWRAGMAICWEGHHHHSTWNGSWKKRPQLQITGSMTDETVQLIREATLKRYIEYNGRLLPLPRYILHPH